MCKECHKDLYVNEIEEKNIEIIDNVIKLLKDKSVIEISNLSHKEEGWKKTKKYEDISFEYAMKLNVSI